MTNTKWSAYSHLTFVGHVCDKYEVWTFWGQTAKCKTYVVLDGVRVPNSKPTNFMTKPQHLTFNSDQHQILDLLLQEKMIIKKMYFFVFSHGLTCFRQQQTIIPKIQNIKFWFLLDYQDFLCSYVSIDLIFFIYSW